jgi:subtilisin family serine protease
VATEPPPSAAPATPDVAADPTADGRPDATGQFIVILRGGTDTAAVVEKGRKRDGLKADKSFTRAVRGFAAKLDNRQKRDLLADPNVVAVVPDEVIQVTQTIPTGIARVGARKTKLTEINAGGTGGYVNADVAIIDTGLSAHPDLNVAGGYNCSSADRTAWGDGNNHGTHVAGIVGALDNSYGVVGVAPGARMYGVKILNDSGYGLVSWYICGLDWVLAQRDPGDASRPLFEAVNMSVTKYGLDDANCGLTNNDPLHQAICRVVAGGITVVAAAANDSHNAKLNIPASYDEVITVSALADTDGLAGGLGANKCFSWGGYDKDDTFADFSNYGTDVDIMAPGKCILSTVPGPTYAYMSGTSMAAPTVAGAVALYKASRPAATPAEVRTALRFLGNLGWSTATDPDPYHEPLLDVSRLGALGVFDLQSAASSVATVEGGAAATIPIRILRSATFFEAVRLTAVSVPAGWTAGPMTTSALGWDSTIGSVAVQVPFGTPAGRYQVGVQGVNQGRTVNTTIDVNVVEDLPTAVAPQAGVLSGVRLNAGSVLVRVNWPAATDPSSAIAGYEIQSSRAGGAWSASLVRTATQLTANFTLPFGTSVRFRVRAQDAVGHWSPWVLGTTTAIVPVDDRSALVKYRGTWSVRSQAAAVGGTLKGASRAGASARLAFTGHAIAVVAPRMRTRGSAAVYIDGVYVFRLNLRASGLARQVVYHRLFPAGGTHSIELRVLGTAPYPRVELDAFIITR